MGREASEIPDHRSGVGLALQGDLFDAFEEAGMVEDILFGKAPAAASAGGETTRPKGWR